MRILPFHLLIAGIGFLGCLNPGVSFAKTDEQRQICDMATYIEKFGEGKGTCIARAVADRCNRVDACIFQCKLEGKDDTVAGGCFRMCADGKEWEAPPAVAACDG